MESQWISTVLQWTNERSYFALLLIVTENDWMKIDSISTGAGESMNDRKNIQNYK